MEPIARLVFYGYFEFPPPTWSTVTLKVLIFLPLQLSPHCNNVDASISLHSFNASSSIVSKNQTLSVLIQHNDKLVSENAGLPERPYRVTMAKCLFNSELMESVFMQMHRKRFGKCSTRKKFTLKMRKWNRELHRRTQAKSAICSVYH